MAQLLKNAGRSVPKEPMVTLTFFPPASYLTMNQRKHWRWVAKQKKAWREITAILARLQHEHWDTTKKDCKSTVEFVFPVTQNRRRDPHNYYPTVKPIVDGLTDAGFWLDDTPEYVETREPIFYKGETVHVLIHQPKRS